MSISRLPKDALLYTFSFFSARQVVKLGGVCREWRRLTSENSLWRLLSERDWPQSSKEATPVSWKQWYQSHFIQAFLPRFNQPDYQPQHAVSQQGPAIASYRNIGETVIFSREHLIFPRFYEDRIDFYFWNLHAQSMRRVKNPHTDSYSGWKIIGDTLISSRCRNEIENRRIVITNLSTGITQDISDGELYNFALRGPLLALLYRDRIQLRDGVTGVLQKSFQIETTTIVGNIYLTETKVVAVLESKEIYVFDLVTESKTLYKTPIMSCWCLKDDFFYYADENQLFEINLKDGTKRQMSLGESNTYVFDSMICSHDYLVLLNVKNALLQVIDLKTFSVQWKHPISSEAEYMKTYGNILLIGEKNTENTTSQILLIDLHPPQRILHRFQTLVPSSRPYFYDGKIFSDGVTQIDSWDLHSTGHKKE